MSTRKIYPLIAPFLLLFTGPVEAQSSYGHQLRKLNQRITVAYLHRDTAGLLRIYADNAVSMPEYHLTLFGKKAIREYRRAWMDSATVQAYSRQTNDITKSGDYLVETGTFSNHFSRRNRVVVYEGKYLCVWQIKPAGSLQLISEITGSGKPIDRADLPLSALQLPDTAQIPKPGAGQASSAIQSLNDEVAALVVQRKGREFAKYYTDDAIYAPYYMPMLTGRAASTPITGSMRTPITSLAGYILERQGS